MNRTRIRKFRAAAPAAAAVLALAAAAGEDARSVETRVSRRLKSIVIPEASFRQADIRDVVQFLALAARDNDPEHKGVNIVLNLGAKAENPPLVTFDVRGLSLHEILKIVTQVAGLKCRIEGSVAMVVPANAPDGEIVVRMYPVKPNAVEQIRSLRDAMTLK
jgi:hypothetical protein